MIFQRWTFLWPFNLVDWAFFCFLESSWTIHVDLKLVVCSAHESHEKCPMNINYFTVCCGSLNKSYYNIRFGCCAGSKQPWGNQERLWIEIPWQSSCYKPEKTLCNNSTSKINHINILYIDLSSLFDTDCQFTQVKFQQNPNTKL